MVLSNKAWADLARINRWVNENVTPMTDLEHWGAVEKWAYPDDGYGDCEDYVLLKRRMLMEAGWPRAALLITVVREKNGNGHAVLTVKTDKGEFILRPPISTQSTSAPQNGPASRPTRMIGAAAIATPRKTRNIAPSVISSGLSDSRPPPSSTLGSLPRLEELEDVDGGEDDDPHDVDEVPVDARHLDAEVVLRLGPEVALRQARMLAKVSSSRPTKTWAPCRPVRP